MKFGLTRAERDKLFRDYVVQQSQWRDKFAIFPILLDCGRVAWLETVQVRDVYNPYFNRQGYQPWHSEAREKLVSTNSQERK